MTASSASPAVRYGQAALIASGMVGANHSVAAWFAVTALVCSDAEEKSVLLCTRRLVCRFAAAALAVKGSTTPSNFQRAPAGHVSFTSAPAAGVVPEIVRG